MKCKKCNKLMEIEDTEIVSISYDDLNELLKKEKEDFVNFINEVDIKKLDSQNELEKSFINQIVKRDNIIRDLRQQLQKIEGGRK